MKRAVSLQLPPGVIALAWARAGAEGIPFCVAVARSIEEANGPRAAAEERSRMVAWQGFRGAPSRPFTPEERAAFSEIFRTYVAGTPLPPDVWDDENVAVVRALLSSSPLAPAADDYAVVLCGLLSDRPAAAALWAHTLHTLRRISGGVVTLDVWLRYFPTGVPTGEATAALWRDQTVFLGGTAPRNYTQMPDQWPT